MYNYTYTYIAWLEDYWICVWVSENIVRSSPSADCEAEIKW